MVWTHSGKPVLLGLLSGLMCLPALTATKAADSTGQYISKIYTEGFGRVPDQPLYNYFVSAFQQNGCGTFITTFVARVVYNSEEYDRIYGTGPAAEWTGRILSLFRGTLSRDPRQDEHDAALPLLSSGQLTWSDYVDFILNSPEFQNLTQGIICAPPSGQNTGQYGWRGTTAFDRSNRYASPGPLAGNEVLFEGQSDDDLNAWLNALPAGYTLLLKQGSVVFTNTPINIPTGRRLATYGYPTTQQYTKMARIIRASNYVQSPANQRRGQIAVSGGASLNSVWIDGNVTNLRGFNGGCPTDAGGLRECTNVVVYGDDQGIGYETVIRSNRVSDTNGWSNLLVYGNANVSADSGPEACGSTDRPVTVDGNLLTLYGTSHYDLGFPGGPWSDGISSECNTSVIINNQVVDATDYGIILFGPFPDQPGNKVQRSIVQNNTVINSGNAAFASIGIDTRIPIDRNQAFQYGCSAGRLRTEVGANFSNNLIWTSASSFVDIGVALGAWPLAPSLTGRGLTLQNNTSGSGSINASNGIVIYGMCDVFVDGNSFNFQLADHHAGPANAGCYFGSPLIAVVGYAEGSALPPGFTYLDPAQTKLTPCIVGNQDRL